MTSPGTYASAPSIQQVELLQQDHEQSKTKVELSIRCRNLPDCDIITKSDPQVIVYRFDPIHKDKLYELGRTEVIADDLNPIFAKKIFIDYHFEQIQRLRFQGKLSSSRS